MVHLIASLALALPCPAVPGPQTPSTLLADLDPSPNPELQGTLGSGNPSMLGTALGKLWFNAFRPGVQTNLWSIDSPGALAQAWSLDGLGTFPLEVDRLQQLDPEQLLLSVNTLAPGLGGTYLTDGTTKDAVRLSELPFSSSILVNGVAYLAQPDTETSTTVLTSTDGTLAGTQTLAVIDASPLQFLPLEGGGQRLWEVGGRLVYGVPLGGDVLELSAQSLSGGPPELIGEFVDNGFLAAAKLGDRLLFTAEPAGASESLLWTTDGTASGTSVLVDFQPGPGDGAAKLLACDGLRAVLSADPTGLGGELHLTDGTVSGTVQITNLSSGSGFNAPTAAVSAGSGFVFTYVSDESPTTTGAYYTNGIATAPDQLTPPGFGLVSGLVSVLGGAAFLENSSSQTRPLWWSDTTPSGTFPLTGDGITLPNAPAGFGGELWFGAGQAGLGRELFRATPTPLSATFAEDMGTVAETKSSFENSTIVVGTGRAWSIVQKDGQSQLMSTDGTPEGTSVVGKGLFPEVTALGAALGEGLLFAAPSPPMAPATSGSVQPWFSDGTPSGTVFLGTLSPGSNNTLAALEGNAAVLGSRIIFGARNAPTPSTPSLWATDGTSAGTELITELLPGESDVSLQGLVRAGDRVFFVVRQDFLFGLPYDQLWMTDGTAAGTGPVPGLPTFRKVFQLTATGDRVCFFTRDPTFAGEGEFWTLRATDGTSSGPLSLGSYDVSLFPANLRIVDGRPVVLAYRILSVADLDTGEVEELFDFTSEGYAILRPSTGQGDLAYFQLVPGALNSGSFEPGLWSTDGTAEGTQFVDSSTSDSLVVGSDGAALFVSSSATTGPEPWITDGTPLGTRPLEDALPGPIGTLEVGLIFGGFVTLTGARVGTHVIYRGYDPVSGFEPHAISILGTGSYVSETFGQSCAASAPSLAVDGAVLVDAPVGITIAGAAPLSATGLYASAASTVSPLGACTLYLELPIRFADLSADARGAASLPFAIPADPALAGLALYLQGANLTAGGGFGGIANLTNAVELVFGQ